MVDDGVNSDGSLSSLSVTNDQFSLTSSNRYLILNINSKISLRILYYILSKIRKKE